MNIYRIKDPFVLTIFGASGDLAKLKLFPALYSLAEQKRLPPDFAIVGFARTKKSRKEFQKEFADSVREKEGKNLDEKILRALVAHVYYFTGQYDRLVSFVEYKKFMGTITKKKRAPHIAYFAVPPQAFEPIIKNLGESRSSVKDDIRLIIEKPFGRDAASAQELYHFIARYFHESQTYLLDHFLGKSGVQSILHLRETNRILNLLLQGREIANIQITAEEDIGVTNRVGYFEQVGIIKDMVQSHLLQILALTTMSIPISDNPESLHREKHSILSALKMPAAGNNVVIAQYNGYKKERGVPANSRTETFAALRLFIDQEAWYNVPIYIRTGKKLRKKQTYIVVEFKKFAFQNSSEEPNLLVIELGPDEKVIIQLVNKYRSGESKYETVTTSESIACSGDYCLPEHGLLFLDVIRKNKMSFLSFPEILASWKITETVCSRAKKNRAKIETYQGGSSGPESQHLITRRDGFTWHDLA